VTALLPRPTEHLPTVALSASDIPTSLTLSPATSTLLAGVVERLYREYECCLPLTTVIEVVASCLDDIQATRVEALPELTERLARHRLAQIGHPGWT
jgi:hypothetical protein